MQAQYLLQELEVLTQARGWALLYREVIAVQAQLRLAVGDLPTVQSWQALCSQLDQDFRIVQQEQEAFITAHLLIVRGEIAAALHLLERWQKEARAEKRIRSALEMRFLLLWLTLHIIASIRPQKH